jgi:tRNA-splicing ligase RtcB
MPRMYGDKGKQVLSWATHLEDNTLEQAILSSDLPFIPGHVALMPDAHLGYGATVGSVIPTLGAIIPAAVGVDIGCGMAAVKTDLTASDLPDSLGPLHGKIREAVPAGVGQAHESLNRTPLTLPQTELNDKQVDTANKQMGTLGAGNHFVEVCLDQDNEVWVVLHSGSRGIGNQLARYHIDIAKGIMEEYFITLGDPDLAYFVEGTPEFNHYWSDLQWAQDYAARNRATMLEGVMDALASQVRTFKILETINCHHNYTELENHQGKNMYVTRKGAIRARVGDMGIIPGSMGTNSYIVKGLGNPASYNSAPHGAGRAMSRGAARRRFTEKDMRRVMYGKVWNDRQADKLVDEHPESYKDIHEVIRDSASLAEVTHELTQVLNYKGT